MAKQSKHERGKHLHIDVETRLFRLEIALNNLLDFKRAVEPYQQGDQIIRKAKAMLNDIGRLRAIHPLYTPRQLREIS